MGVSKTVGIIVRNHRKSLIWFDRDKPIEPIKAFCPISTVNRLPINDGRPCLPNFANMKAILTILLSVFMLLPGRIYAAECPEEQFTSGECVFVDPLIEAEAELDDADSTPEKTLEDDSVGINLNPFKGLSVEVLEKLLSEYEAREHKRDGDKGMRLYEGDSHELTMENLILVLGEAGLSNQLYVLAQAVLETGNFKSNVCKNYNNLFGLYNSRKKEYYRFHRWEDSVIGYKKFIQHRYKGGNYLAFLKRIRYAEDPGYIRKVAKIANKLYRDLFKN